MAHICFNPLSQKLHHPSGMWSFLLFGSIGSFAGGLSPEACPACPVAPGDATGVESKALFKLAVTPALDGTALFRITTTKSCGISGIAITYVMENLLNAEAVARPIMTDF